MEITNQFLSDLRIVHGFTTRSAEIAYHMWCTDKLTEQEATAMQFLLDNPFDKMNAVSKPETPGGFIKILRHLNYRISEA